MISNKAFIRFSFLIVCVLPAISFGQGVTSSVDKNEILIGEQFQCTIKATISNLYQVEKFDVTDTTNHFEVISKTEMDSLKEKNTITYTQTITYTSFDSGRWVLPAVKLNAKFINSDSTIIFKADSLFINVLYAPADSTNTLRDIKPIILVTVKDYFWYYVGGGLLLLLILVWAIWKYFKKRKTVKKEISYVISPYEEALKELEKLTISNAASLQELKHYHISLSRVFKKYFSHISGKNLLNHTTSSTLIELNKANVDKDIVAKISTILRMGDAAKFAKFFPSDEENVNCKISMIEVIKRINQDFKI